MQQTLSALKTIFREPFYRKAAVIGSLAVALLSYWFFYKVTTVTAFVQMARYGEFGPYSIPYAIAYALTTVAIILFSGVSAATAIWLYRHSKLGRSKGLWANAGGFSAAMLGMGCPICGAFLLSAIGIAGGLAVFPLQGLELKFVSLGLLVGSTYYAARKVPAKGQVCEDCGDVTHATRPKAVNIAQNQPPDSRVVLGAPKNLVVLPLEKIFIPLLIVLFLSNQFFIDRASTAMGTTSSGGVRLFGTTGASASTIIAPQLNPDGKTTSLVEQPTITEVPANPNSGDALADAKVVMFPTGVPFYAPEGISFDDPINAQNKWGAFENSITLSGALQDRYDQLTNTFTCNYCCGGPTRVTQVSRCGCRHAKAWRGFFKYMLQTYGDQYTNEQLMGEAFRWSGIWYPKGVIQDYLLATGTDVTFPHETHGGAGADGRHGL